MISFTLQISWYIPFGAIRYPYCTPQLNYSGVTVGRNIDSVLRRMR